MRISDWSSDVCSSDLGHQPRSVDRRLAEAGAKRIMMGAQPVKLRIELIQMGEVAQADRATAHLVLIGGTDAAPRRADLARAAGVFAQPVTIAVEGQDKRDVFGDVEIVRRGGDALGGTLLLPHTGR